MWVVLRYENLYDQFGGYFVGVFESEADCISPNGHFGRRDGENTWYEAIKVDVGKMFDYD